MDDPIRSWPRQLSERDSEIALDLLREGYLFPRKFPTGEWAAVMPFLFTFGLVVGIDPIGDRSYRCRWCYPDVVSALEALMHWDGMGDDPPGEWTKQKGRNAAGRSVDRSRTPDQHKDRH